MTSGLGGRTALPPMRISHCIIDKVCVGQIYSFESWPIEQSRKHRKIFFWRKQMILTFSKGARDEKSTFSCSTASKGSTKKSSSSESSGAPVRRGMRRAKHELRHGIIGHAIDGRHIDGINRMPYITHTQHDLDGLPGYSSHGRRDDARRQAALRNCPYN